MGTSRGIDVSVYQGPQDWAAHKADGVSFAFAKASEGRHTRDAHFKQHITAIKAAGLVPGAYHYGWPNQNVDDEAANYTAAVKPYAGPGFIHWLDLERRSDGTNYAGRSHAQIAAWAKRWIELVAAAHPGQRVGIYTSGDDISHGHAPADAPLWYPRYPWTSGATYAKAEAAARPRPSGRDPLFWQFTSKPIDRSICYLTAAALRAWAGGAATEEDDVPIRTSLGKDTAQTLAWDAWTAINWDAEYSDPQDAHAAGNHPGYISPLSTWADFNGRLVLEGIPAGAHFQIRYEVHEWKNGASVGSWHEIIADVLATPGQQIVSLPFSKGLDKGRHVYVAVCPITPDGSSGLPAPTAVDGRWAIRQDK
ncbi:glycoside hydrolase family 25 protein [Streptomyces sp. NPDC059373]